MGSDKTSSQRPCRRTAMKGNGKSKEGKNVVGEDDFSLACLCARGSTTRALMWQTARPARLPHSDLVLLLRVACRELIRSVINMNSFTDIGRYIVHGTGHRTNKR